MITKTQEERIDHHAESLYNLAVDTKSSMVILMIGNMEGDPKLKLVHVAYCTSETREEIEGRPDAIAAIMQTCKTAGKGVEMVELMQKLSEASDA